MNLKNLILIGITFTLGISSALFASDKDNGGSLTAMQKVRGLSRDEIIEYLTSKSPILRRALEGLVLYVPLESIKDDTVRNIVVKMRSQGDDTLLDDVRYSNFTYDSAAFRNECGADDRKDLCTRNNVLAASIFFNIESLVTKNVSLSQLIGLIMHEVSRHFACGADEKHALANFYMEAFIRNAQIGKVFTHTDGLRVKGDGKDYVYAASTSASKNQIQASATSFCIYRGYKLAASHELENAGLSGISGVWYLTDGNLPNAYNGFSGSTPFAQIVCTGKRSDD